MRTLSTYCFHSTEFCISSLQQLHTQHRLDVNETGKNLFGKAHVTKYFQSIQWMSLVIVYFLFHNSFIRENSSELNLFMKIIFEKALLNFYHDFSIKAGDKKFCLIKNFWWNYNQYENRGKKHSKNISEFRCRIKSKNSVSNSIVWNIIKKEIKILLILYIFI